jgi:amino acid transporter
MATTAGRTLFTRQSSGLVREVSVLNALFFNTAAFIGGGVGWYPLSYSLAFVPVGTLAMFTTYGWGTLLFGVFAVIFGIIFASLATVMPRSGGDYVFTSRLIPRIGPFLGWLESFTLVFACIAIVMFEIKLVQIGVQVTGRIVGIGTGSEFFAGANDWFAEGGEIKGIPGLLSGLVVVAGIFWVVIQSTRRFHRIVTWLGIIGLVSVVAMFVFGLTAVDKAGFEAGLQQYAGTTADALRQSAIDGGVLNPDQSGVDFSIDLGQVFGPGSAFPYGFPMGFVLSVILLNFIGYQYSAYISGEVRGNVRRGVLIGVLGALGIGVLMNSVYVDFYSLRIGLDAQLGWGLYEWTGAEGMPLGQPNLMPLTATLATPGLWPVWALINLGGTLFPFLLCPVYIILISRIMLAWSLDRRVPEWFGAVNERLHAPLNAILTVVGILVALVVLQNFALLPKEIAPPDGRLTLFAFLWLSILLALLTWVMPGINAFVGVRSRPDLMANAPSRRWLPILGIVWAVFAVLIYWVAFIRVIIDGIVAAFGTGAQEGFDYLIGTGIVFTIAIVIAAVAIYTVYWFINRSRGVDTSLMYQQIPPE